MEAILFALVAHIGWGTSGIFNTIVARKIGGYSTTFWSYWVRIPLLALFIPFDMQHVRALTLQNFLLSSLLAIVLLLGSALQSQAFLVGNPSIVGTIGAAFVVPTVILSVIFFDEKLDLYQTLAIVIIIIGLVVTTLDFRSIAQGHSALDQGALLALLALAFWGIYFAFIRIPVEEIGWFLPSYIGYFFAPVLLILMRWRGVRVEKPTKSGALPAFAALVFLSTAANMGYNIGISQGFTSIVAPIAGAYPILFVFLSSLVFKEPLRRQQMIGIAISLVGIVTLGFFS